MVGGFGASVKIQELMFIYIYIYIHTMYYIMYGYNSTKERGKKQLGLAKASVQNSFKAASFYIIKKK